MPIYEFRCPNCHARTSVLSRKMGPPPACRCPFCSSADLVRTVSCFAHHRAAASDRGGTGEDDYYKDPRHIGRWTEQKFRDFGMEMPAQVKETIEKAREGELPDSLRDLKGGTPDAAYH